VAAGARRAAPAPTRTTALTSPRLLVATSAPPPWTAAGGAPALRALVARARWQAAKLVLGRSRIDGTGLFATCVIEAEDVVAEYAGEVVGDAVCDARESYYRRLGIADYMFRLGPDEVVDATLRGCRARDVNHSCDPNCFAAIHTLPAEPPPAAAPPAEGVSGTRAAESAEGGGGGGGGRGGGQGSDGDEEATGSEGTEEEGGGRKGGGHGAGGAGDAAARTYSGRIVLLYAMRRIAPGEELTYDYSFSAEDHPVPCKCGAPMCRAFINKVA
jgi:uncharacterized membrane protein YgcG